MTLTNAFRTRNGGILLCADREETDGYSKTEVDKIYEIPTDLKSCEVYISGAGPSEMLNKAKERIHRTLFIADQGGNDVFAEHQALIEGSLRHIYKEYASVLAKDPMGLIIVAASRIPKVPPLLYSTTEYRLHSQRLYCAHGSGGPISDYLADRLYKESMDTNLLRLLAAFIFREAERKALGVGMGNDMWLIHDGDMARRGAAWDNIEKMKAEIPPLAESIYASWSQTLALKKWLEPK